MSEEVASMASLQTLLTELETYRKKYVKRFLRYRKVRRFYSWTFPVGLVLGAITALLPFLLPFTLPALIAIAIIFVINAVVSSGISKKEDNFYERFKNEVMPAAVNMAREGLKYNVVSDIDKEFFSKANLLDERVDRYHTEDMIVGRFGQVDFKACEVRAGKMVLSGSKVVGNIGKGCLAAIADIFFDLGDDGMGDDGSDENRKYKKLFHGLFVIVDFHKSFAGGVLLRPKVNSVSTLVKTDLERVEMGDVSFDKQYSIYSSDKTLARYVLSPYLIQQINVLNELSPESVLVSFQGGYMCIGVPQERDLFECDFYKGLPDMSAFEELVAEVKIIERLLDHLDQNTRIWGEKAMKD